MGGLNVVALISGGKDSFFSMLHCQRNGHRIVALANLYPSQGGRDAAVEDSESYMYQTIGHAVIPQYQDALQLPLYRQEILGSAVNQAKSYGPATLGSSATSTESDETESLMPLLRKVLQAHPEINAVSSGAIMSDYQRTRVESVAIRLGLVPLSYLWQWPSLAGHSQSSLLEDMSTVGQDARIIKVASGGLDESFLWQNVADHRTITRLTNAARRFGAPDDGAVLGEGGEYETLCVAGPAPLWKGRIVINPESMQTVPGEAGSAAVRVLDSSVTPLTDCSPIVEVPKPAILDDPFQQIIDRLVENQTTQESSSEIKESLRPGKPFQTLDSVTDSVEQEGDVILLSALTGKGSSASEQTQSIMAEAVARVSNMGLQTSDIAYTTIILRDMHDFAAVNDAYRTYFTEPNPAARLTIACAEVLPADSLLMMSMTVAPGSREGLHVQSRSYWAPANIGPYSQAIRFPTNPQTPATDATVFVSGQIALEPASMDIYCPAHTSPAISFLHEAVLALQHLARIGKCMKVLFWTNPVAFVASTNDDDIQHRVQLARCVWKAYIESTAAGNDSPDVDEREDFDVWHLQNRRGPGRQQTIVHAVEGHESCGPLTVIVVDSLPRGAAIEWVGTGKHARTDMALPESFHLKDVLRTLERFSERFYADM
ncbi:adenine nucleotide alpha hydrolases-like protein [Dissoconium aciculare CBS 342.82]|uniref:Diphthine--ammonia ligase n=1 Tax=Dissoconium aciculare CBS 342.82 TaxID=1314786 RepID=A0A6J3M7V7_9PEZI|nr:adenine nucleotide alpha hydrolases-like protein [Dissoconium aciculare CBS 342.82]KAF1824131.1 adenine nucleotide alpha hydrolases-like protein [Dissoconium aciculare CBS 342.82]